MAYESINKTAFKTFLKFMVVMVTRGFGAPSMATMATHLLRAPQNFIIESSSLTLTLNSHDNNSPQATLANCLFLTLKKH